MGSLKNVTKTSFFLIIKLSTLTLATMCKCLLCYRGKNVCAGLSGNEKKKKDCSS